ncbi:hypothetical protein KSP40_PGU016245 [Platanthera guangdongensis]|uniref:Magnesium chelatase n=1 Tax=Platanthera guangdongensis TaxID=2320717 RepID=A0ABR2N1E6_9ASPA
MTVLGVICSYQLIPHCPNHHQPPNPKLSGNSAGYIPFCLLRGRRITLARPPPPLPPPMAGLLAPPSSSSATLPFRGAPTLLSLSYPSPASLPAQIPWRGSSEMGARSSSRKGFRRLRISNVAASEVSSTAQAKKLAAKDVQRPVYPFTAIVGQEEMKLCLLLNVIDPKIGGVMIMGDRGTGKSTTVRSLIDLLPEIKVVIGDPFNSDPDDPESMGIEVRELIMKGEKLPSTTTKITMVDLPLGATEDRVGTVRDAELRVRIVEERARFDTDPKGFRESYALDQEKLQQQITSARTNLSLVHMDREIRVKISKVCSELNVDGLRGDIVTNGLQEPWRR